MDYLCRMKASFGIQEILAAIIVTASVLYLGWRFFGKHKSEGACKDCQPGVKTISDLKVTEEKAEKSLD